MKILITPPYLVSSFFLEVELFMFYVYNITDFAIFDTQNIMTSYPKDLGMENSRPVTALASCELDKLFAIFRLIISKIE